MAHAGIRAYFKLDSGDAVAVPTEISTWLDGITPSSDTDELDGTTFQPGVATPTKQIVAGFKTRGFSLSVKWNEEAELFFSGVENKNGLNYAYGPLGKDVGMLGISGVCNCISWTGPVATVDGVLTGTVELRADTRILGEFDAAGAVTPAAGQEAEIARSEELVEQAKDEQAEAGTEGGGRKKKAAKRR